MDLPTVDNCCFGLLPLKTGAIVAGIVCFILELVVHGGNTYYSNGTDWLQTVYGLLVIFGIISSVLLIVGVLMDNKVLVQCFLIAFVLLIIFTIVLLVLSLLNRSGHSVNYIVSSIVYICIIGYCLIVANSYAKTMAG